jgi:flagellar biosynthetic protein FlhB
MAGEKQFEATPSRLEKAKREGDLARSQELGNVAAFAAALGGTCGVITPLASAVTAALRTAASGRIDEAALFCGFALMLVPLACAACAAAGSGTLQSSGLRFVSVGFKVERLSPQENLKRILSRESLVAAARAIIAFACAAAGLVPAIGAVCSASLHAGSLFGISGAAFHGALEAAAIACIVGGVFAGADYGVQLVRWRKRLRMSFEELKRDQKEHDGDPAARGRRRALHGQIARGSLRRVKEAAFVITNPTHIAIALEYRPPDVPVPRILVRAADEAAARVRELAASYGVPMIENVPLARTLYASARAGEYIPSETYLAVAEIVAALTAKSGVMGRTPSAQSPAPARYS